MGIDRRGVAMDWGSEEEKVLLKFAWKRNDLLSPSAHSHPSAGEKERDIRTEIGGKAEQMLPRKRRRDNLIQSPQGRSGVA